MRASYMRHACTGSQHHPELHGYSPATLPAPFQQSVPRPVLRAHCCQHASYLVCNPLHLLLLNLLLGLPQLLSSGRPLVGSHDRHPPPPLLLPPRLVLVLPPCLRLLLPAAGSLLQRSPGVLQDGGIEVGLSAWATAAAAVPAATPTSPASPCTGGTSGKVPMRVRSNEPGST